ncbi:MAG: hypothetical protein H6722_01680 [Sandaracinus sp.]|nr:hypothetical protein [Sandaracinus sp.]
MLGMNISREVAMIPVLPGVEPRWLMYLLSCPGGQALIGAKVKGVAQAGINLSDVRGLPVPLPSQAEQARMVDLVDTALARVAALEERWRMAYALGPRIDRAILAKAFRGELVPQDPNDEPAERMLARLAASAETSPPKGKRGPRKKRA